MLEVNEKQDIRSRDATVSHLNNLTENEFGAARAELHQACRSLLSGSDCTEHGRLWEMSRAGYSPFSACLHS